MDKKKKEKYKKHLEEARDQTINDLEPVVKNGTSRIIDIIQEVCSDFISEIFEKTRNRMKSNKNQGCEK